MPTPIAASLSLPSQTPGPAPLPARREPEARGDGDQHVLERAQVAVDVAAAPREIEDRIADQLARAVIRHVAAAADPQHGRPRHQHVAHVAAPPERDHGRCSTSKQLLGPARDDVAPRLLLEGERLFVATTTETTDLDRALPRGTTRRQRHSS